MFPNPVVKTGRNTHTHFALNHSIKEICDLDGNCAETKGKMLQ